MHEVDIPVDLISKPQGAKLLDLELNGTLRGGGHKSGDSLGGTHIDLGDYLWLPLDSGDFANVEVGSSLLGLYMEMRHGVIISGRVLHVKKIMHFFAYLKDITDDTEGSYDEIVGIDKNINWLCTAGAIIS
jgi:hypothetical protein